MKNDKIESAIRVLKSITAFRNESVSFYKEDDTGEVWGVISVNGVLDSAEIKPLVIHHFNVHLDFDPEREKTALYIY